MKNTAYSVQSTDRISLSGEAGLPVIIGITGGIGSGKSTIGRALAAHGFSVYDCDQEAKRIIGEDQEVQTKIIELLGKEAFIDVPDANGLCTKVYNTGYVAQKVFSSPALLARLNGIVHPAVRQDIVHRKPDFVESAILYESGLDRLCTKIVVVEAPEEVRISRTISRDYHGEASEENMNQVRARIHSQHAFLSSCGNEGLDSSEGVLHLPNDGFHSIEELVAQILAWKEA